jgi:hypothetical protein
MDTYVHIYMRVYVRVNVYACVYTYLYGNHMYTHTNIYAYG